MPKPQADAAPPAPRLYLITPVIEDAAAFARELPRVIGETDVAAVLLRLKDADERTLINRVKALAGAVQETGAALLLDGRAELAARGGADGAHLNGTEEFEAAVGSLKPERIAGCGGLITRHDAMTAAERGADYVMFGDLHDGREPPFDSVLERVAWWAEVFEVPCVGYAREATQAGRLAEAGADFVAVDFVWTDRSGAAAALAEAGRALAQAAAARMEPAR